MIIIIQTSQVNDWYIDNQSLEKNAYLCSLALINDHCHCKGFIKREFKA